MFFIYPAFSLLLRSIKSWHKIPKLQNLKLRLWNTKPTICILQMRKWPREAHSRWCHDSAGPSWVEKSHPVELAIRWWVERWEWWWVECSCPEWWVWAEQWVLHGLQTDIMDGGSQPECSHSKTQKSIQIVQGHTGSDRSGTRLLV